MKTNKLLKELKLEKFKITRLSKIKLKSIKGGENGNDETVGVSKTTSILCLDKPK
jgi:hypothetical protein